MKKNPLNEFFSDSDYKKLPLSLQLTRSNPIGNSCDAINLVKVDKYSLSLYEVFELYKPISKIIKYKNVVKK
ncbi:MAG: hypothetical protein A2X01_09205 [Bacteroidetes bacterium GWF2_35_48]|nr:MAG: hypothetical protein A2X01_09205 [Bacteroidetes bacterium GWF2_35_48]